MEQQKSQLLELLAVVNLSPEGEEAAASPATSSLRLLSRAVEGKEPPVVAHEGTRSLNNDEGAILVVKHYQYLKNQWQVTSPERHCRARFSQRNTECLGR